MPPGEERKRWPGPIFFWICSCVHFYLTQPTWGAICRLVCPWMTDVTLIHFVVGRVRIFQSICMSMWKLTLDWDWFTLVTYCFTITYSASFYLILEVAVSNMCQFWENALTAHAYFITCCQIQYRPLSYLDATPSPSTDPKKSVSQSVTESVTFSDCN